MQEQRKSWSIGAIVDKKAEAEIRKLVGNELGLGSAVLNKVAYTGTQFDAVFEFNFCYNDKTQCSLAIVNYGCPESRILLAGRELVVGFRYNDVPGQNFNLKYRHLCQLPADKALELAEKIGFVVDQNTKGQVVFIPAGYFVLTATHSSGAEILRWSLFPAEDASPPFKLECDAARIAITQLIEAFPALRNCPHLPFSNHLELVR